MRDINFSKISSRRLFFSLIFGVSNFFILLSFTHADSSLKNSELRCGWFDNPSPGNAELTDTAGVWLVAQQGEYKAEGAWPKFSAGQWVQTGTGSYGYGCLCIFGKFDSETRRVLVIEKTVSKPTKLCRTDKKINEVEPFNPLK
ncbi:MAG: DUF4087 domain-containing protein [Acidovorax sp.]|uniref:DUF4087 domain-containing protein n=1 Tax=Acidovorax sp. TaxID=1872122 RepID=UPI0039188718